MTLEEFLAEAPQVLPRFAAAMRERGGVPEGAGHWWWAEVAAWAALQEVTDPERREP